MKHTVQMDNVHISSYANLVLLQKVYSQMERTRWDRARKKFLADELKRGPLSCKYCGKTLVLKADRKHEQVTVDHVMPKSLGGDPFCSTNFAVACNSCNHRKSSITEDNFVNGSYLKVKKKHTS